MTFTASGPRQGDGWRMAVPSHYIWDSYDIKTFIFFFHLNTSISYSIANKVFSLPKILNYDFTLFFVGGDFPSQMIWSVFE